VTYLPQHTASAAELEAIRVPRSRTLGR